MGVPFFQNTGKPLLLEVHGLTCTPLNSHIIPTG